MKKEPSFLPRGREEGSFDFFTVDRRLPLSAKLLIRVIAAFLRGEALHFPAFDGFANVTPASNDQADERAERKASGHELQYQTSSLSHNGYPLVMLYCHYTRLARGFQPWIFSRPRCASGQPTCGERLLTLPCARQCRLSADQTQDKLHKRNLHILYVPPMPESCFCGSCPDIGLRPISFHVLL